MDGWSKQDFEFYIKIILLLCRTPEQMLIDGLKNHLVLSTCLPTGCLSWDISYLVLIIQISHIPSISKIKCLLLLSRHFDLSVSW